MATQQVDNNQPLYPTGIRVNAWLSGNSYCRLDSQGLASILPLTGGRSLLVRMISPEKKGTEKTALSFLGGPHETG